MSLNASTYVSVLTVSFLFSSHVTVCLFPFAFLSPIYFSFLVFSFLSGKTEATAATKKVHFSVIVGDCSDIRVTLKCSFLIKDSSYIRLGKV